MLIHSLNTEKKIVSKILGAMMSKNVQLQYSGIGREVRGQGKQNFSRTEVSAILVEATTQKLGVATDLKKLQTTVSKWLSGAKDREGGRYNR